MYTIKKETKYRLFNLLVSADFDVKRIVIADHEIDDDCLTILVEDKNNLQDTLDTCIEIKISLEELAAFIVKEKHNSYRGISLNKKGHAYQDDIKINDPIPFYNEDATSVQQQWIREEIIQEIISELLASVTHG